jgi:uncharacterized membrane protein
MNQITLYFVTLAIFVGIDLVWLGFIAKSFYRAEIGTLLAEKMSLPAAASFYVLYAAGLMFFAVQPSLATGGWSRALMLGGLFGFVAYATYDLSNLATLRGWTVKLSVVDMAWGATLSGFTAAVAVLIADRYTGQAAI